MPSSKPDFVPEVVAVREDEGRLPEIIPQQFQLRVRHSQQGLVLFCLVVSFADGAPATKTTVYLQITADSLDSLDRTDYNKTNANAKNPPYLEDVYERLKGMHSVARLQFRLRTGEGIQLAVPLDFNVEKIDDTARSTFESAESLAAASFFSLYFRHNILSKTSFRKYKAAVLPFESVTKAVRESYKDMLDMKRLYNGAGGRVHIPRHHHHHHHSSSPPTTECCSSPAPFTTASCGSTLPFETVPRLQQELPPPYDECRSEEQSPRVIPDAKSPGGDLPPPGYGETERRHNVLDLSQGALPCGKQDTDTHPTSKRKRSFAAVCSPRTARGASRPVKIPPSPFLDPDDENNAAHFLHLLELQRQQIELQREHIEHLQKNVRELQRRHGELEADCLRLETRQDQVDDDIDNLNVAVSELDGKHEELRNQMLDVSDELKDWEENMGETLKEDTCTLAVDRMAEKLEECAQAQADEVRRRICQALQQV